MNAPVRIGNFAGIAERGPAPRLVRFAVEADPVAAAASRTFSVVLSDGSTDRYGDQIDPAGWQIANYKKNPVVLFGHDASSAANVMGSAKNVRVAGGQLLADIVFVPPNINPTADTVCAMVAAGILRTVSVGFAPIAYAATKDPTRRGGIDFSSVELLELSIVPIPANPNAMIQAKSFTGAARLHLSQPTQPEFTMRRSAATHDDAAYRREAAAELRTAHGRDFPSFGSFLQAVAAAAGAGGQADARLVRAPTGAGEVDPTSGGFLVPVEYLETLIESLYQESVLAKLCDRRQTAKNTTLIPGIDETSRANGSRYGGTASYWKDEGSTVTPSFPKYRAVAFNQKKLIAFSVSTGELMDDAPALGDHVMAAFTAEASFMLDLAIFSGTGAGTPLGLLGSPATIVVPKLTGQAAAWTPPSTSRFWRGYDSFLVIGLEAERCEAKLVFSTSMSA